MFGEQLLGQAQVFMCREQLLAGQTSGTEKSSCHDTLCLNIFNTDCKEYQLTGPGRLKKNSSSALICVLEMATSTEVVSQS